MTDFLNKSSVLVLNSLFQCIGTVSPKKSLIALNSSSEQNSVVAKVIDVVYKKNDDGSLNLNELDYWQPLTFEEWTLVEPREGIDYTIKTAKLSLRCPTIITTNFNKMPMRKLRLSKSLLYQLQNGRCGYTNEKIPMNKGNIEHKQAVSHGGKTTFENTMFVKTEINNKRGNKPLSEFPFKPLFSHKEPRPIPVHCLIKSCVHPDWVWFVNNT